MKQFSPFIINHEIVTSQNQLNNYNSIFKAIYGNPGHSYITYSLIKSLFGKYAKCNGWNYWFSTDKEIDEKLEIINDSSHVFLNLQDHIRPQRIEIGADYEKFTKFIEKIKVPIIIPNIGADGGIEEKDIHKNLSKNLTKFLHTLSDHSTYIGIRGAYTQDILSKIGIKNTIITGCPTYYECGRDRVITKHENVSKNEIVYSYPYSLHDIRGESVIQGDYETNIIKAIIDGKKYLGDDKYNWEILDSYCNKKYHFFTNVEDWKNYLKKFKVSAGMRIHGTIIAINSGLNPIIFLRDLRAKEMLDYFEIPYFQPQDVSKDILELWEKCDYSKTNKAYNKLYDNWVDFLHKNDCLMYYENPQIENFEEQKQPKTVKLYPDMPDKNDVIIDLINQSNQKADNLQKQLDYANQKILAIEKRFDKKKERIEKIFSVKNTSDKSHKVVCVLGIKMKFKKPQKTLNSVGGG